jgi:hypothetical protein
MDKNVINQDLIAWETDDVCRKHFWDGFFSCAGVKVICLVQLVVRGNAV